MVVERERPPVPEGIREAAGSLSGLIRIDLQVLRENCKWPNRNVCWKKAVKQHSQFTREFKQFSKILTAFKDAAKTSVPRYERMLDEPIGKSLSRSFGIGTPLDPEVQDILGIIVWKRSESTPDNYNDNDFDKLSEQLVRELEIEDADGNLDADYSEKLTAIDVLGAVLQGKLKISLS